MSKCNYEKQLFELPYVDELELTSNDTFPEYEFESDKNLFESLSNLAGSTLKNISAPLIEDRTNLTPKDRRKSYRDPGTVSALVLHQMAFSRGSDPKKYDTVTSHYAILPDGKITQLHPISALLWSSNGFNKKSVAVEFAGNFPNTNGKCWQSQKYGCHKLTDAQISAGRYLVKHLVDTIGLTHILAHRQANKDRENCPGPDIWFNVGQWAINNLKLKDGGRGFKIDSGNPIPDTWRNWDAIKKVKVNQEFEFDRNLEMEEEINRNSSDYIKWIQDSLNKILKINLVIDGISGSKTRSAIRSFQQRQGLTVDGIVGPITESALIKAGAVQPMIKSSYTPTPNVTRSTTRLGNEIVKIAVQEWIRWNRGKTKETSPTIRSTLIEYWKSVPNGDAIMAKINWWSSISWSAAFISYVVKKAGAGNTFHYDSFHTTYTYYAKMNMLNGVGSFKAYRITQRKPQPGDIVIQNYDRNWNYDNLRPYEKGAHGDIVVEVSSDHIKVIGGHLSESVNLRKYPINASGYLSSGKHWAIVAVDAPANTGLNDTSDKNLNIVSVDGIEVDRTIAESLKYLLNAAKNEGIKLGGSGYRSSDKQIELRKKHCGTTHYDIYEKPSSHCNPPTATPGRSMHEKGLAIDFTFNGASIKSQSNPGFQWLSRNASRFGLYNLPSEPWHWSVNGK